MAVPRKQPLEPHWNFAIAATLGDFQTLTWNFQSINDEVDSRGHAFAGVPKPVEIIAIIDRFLSEDDLFYQGDITRLKEIRQYLKEHVAPMYEHGREAARQYWENIPWEQRDQLTELKFEDFRAEAKNQSPENIKPSQRGWFIEGFCRSWQKQSLHHTASTLGVEPPEVKF